MKWKGQLHDSKAEFMHHLLSIDRDKHEAQNICNSLTLLHNIATFRSQNKLIYGSQLNRQSNIVLNCCNERKTDQKA